jgi:hypothetical protein
MDGAVDTPVKVVVCWTVAVLVSVEYMMGVVVVVVAVLKTWVTVAVTEVV